MSSRDDLIQHLHELYRNDPYINQLYNSIGLEFDKIKEIIDVLGGQIYFDQLTEDIGIPLMEKLLNFKTDPNSSLEDKQSQLEARYKSYGKFSIDLLQAVCNSWKNGDVEAQLINGDISIKFVGEYGVPTDLDNLKKAIQVIKPAQLMVLYSFKYLLISEVESMTLDQLQQQPLSRFAF